MCCFDRCRMRCSLDVLPEWKRPVVYCPAVDCPVVYCPAVDCPVVYCPAVDCPVVDCPLMLISVFYVVEYFFYGEFWLPKLCRRSSVYLWRVLGVTGHELWSVLAMFCGLDRRGDGRLLGCTRSGGMCELC
jgi:hypothetical protein